MITSAISDLYPLPLLISHKIRTTTITTRMIADQKPALKIPPITSQELKLTNIAIARIHMGIICFIARLFPNYAKALPKKLS